MLNAKNQKQKTNKQTNKTTRKNKNNNMFMYLLHLLDAFSKKIAI